MAHGAQSSRADLLHLLKAPSKQAVDEFLCACAEEGRCSGGVDRLRIAEIADTFGLTVDEARSLQHAGTELVRDAVYNMVSTPEQAAELFEDGFHADLLKLLARVLMHHFEEWRADSLAAGGVSTMPKLGSVNWQVYRKPVPGAGSIAAPTMLLGLSLSASANAPSSEVQVEMGKEQLEAMLASLSKVKEQLDQV